MANEYVKAAKSVRGEVSKLTLKQMAEIEKIYADSVKKLQKDFIKNPSGTAAWKKETLKNLVKEKNKTESYIKTGVKKSMKEAAEMALKTPMALMDKSLGKYDLEFGTGSKLLFSQAQDNILKDIIKGNLYKDGKTLDDRIWNMGKGMEHDIQYIISRGIAEKKSAVELAADLEQFVKPAAARPTTWGSSYPSLKNKEVDYNAMRLARTSINHSYQTATIQAAKYTPYAKGIEWESAYAHGRTCQLCKDRAEEDRFGLGAGIFPIDKVPLDHPNGLCSMAPHIPADFDAIADDLNKWIAGDETTEMGQWVKDNKFDFAPIPGVELFNGWTEKELLQQKLDGAGFGDITVQEMLDKSQYTKLLALDLENYTGISADVLMKMNKEEFNKYALSKLADIKGAKQTTQLKSATDLLKGWTKKDLKDEMLFRVYGVDVSPSDMMQPGIFSNDELIKYLDLSKNLGISKAHLKTMSTKELHELVYQYAAQLKGANPYAGLTKISVTKYGGYTEKELNSFVLPNTGSGTLKTIITNFGKDDIVDYLTLEGNTGYTFEQLNKLSERKVKELLYEMAAQLKGMKNPVGNAPIINKNSTQKAFEDMRAMIKAQKGDYNKLMSNFTDEIDFYKANLTRAEQKAIVTYTGGSFRDMNSYLRFGTNADQRTLDLVSNAMSGLSKFSTKDDYVLFRGSSYNSIAGLFDSYKASDTLGGDEWLKQNMNNLIGAVGKDPGFFSASIVDGANFSGNVQYRIKVPAGTEGMYVKEISNYGSEKELLLNAGTQFKIIDIVDKNPGSRYGGDYMIFMEVVPRK